MPSDKVTSESNATVKFGFWLEELEARIQALEGVPPAAASPPVEPAGPESAIGTTVSEPGSASISMGEAGTSNWLGGLQAPNFPPFIRS
jgi:hypothetical protein